MHCTSEIIQCQSNSAGIRPLVGRGRGRVGSRGGESDRVPAGAAHRGDLRDHRGDAARLPTRRSAVVQPRAGPARDRRARPVRPRGARDLDRSRRARLRTGRAGSGELREAVAAMYNRLYRRGLPSQYSAENVCISGGGRVALTRAAASLGQINLGHFLPDYTAYEELLEIFRAFTAIPILLEPERGYAFGADDLRRELLGRGLSALLLSNPCNPTGKLIGGDELGRFCRRRARARLHAAGRRVLLALPVDRRARRTPGRERGALRRGRRSRSGADVRRADQELALPRTGAWRGRWGPGSSSRR